MKIIHNIIIIHYCIHMQHLHLGENTFTICKDYSLPVGNQGVVYVVQDRYGHLYVAKCSHPHSLHTRFNVLTEANIHKNVQNLPNIVKYIQHGTAEDGKTYLLTDYCEGGELYERIIEKTYFPESEAKQCIHDILTAVNSLHQEGIAHRDIKPENIFQKGNTWFLGDFGFAEKESNHKKFNSLQGTPFYISPEILQKHYTKSCDIWACGVILYILLCGQPPFGGETNRHVYHSIKKGVYTFQDEQWQSVSQDAKDLIQNMLCKEDVRFSAKECLSHHWFTL